MSYVISVIPNGTDLIGPLLCAGFGIMASLTIISAPMISIEAKTLWISRSLPLRERDILLSKADVHTLSSLPFIITSVVMMEICIPNVYFGQDTAFPVPIGGDAV